MPLPPTTAIPKGSVVLVTGANGFLGSAVADYFLQNGFKVRGAVRNLEKSNWVKTFFDKRYPGAFEIVQITDMAADGAYDQAAKDTTAIIHVASEVSFGYDPNDFIPNVIKGAVNALKAAYATPSVTRFVLTSSSAAAAPMPAPGDTEVRVITDDTWNDQDVKVAWAEPPYTPERSGSVYAASKTQAEQEVWKFHDENKAARPDLVVNTVLPDLVFGKLLDGTSQGYPSSLGLIHELYEGRPGVGHQVVGNQYYIDVTDAAALHFAGAVLPDVKEERIFGFAGWYTWNDILAILRKHYPEQPIPEELSAPGVAHDIRTRARAEQLLRELGHPGWISLEDSVKAVVESK